MVGGVMAQRSLAVVSPDNISIRSTNTSNHKKLLSKDKSSCEYYNEEAYLEDGDLPSLQLVPSTSFRKNEMNGTGPMTKPIQTTTPTNDNDSKRNATSPFRSFRRNVVTPTNNKSSSTTTTATKPTTPNRNRSSTPILKNTDEFKKTSRFWKRDKKNNNNNDDSYDDIYHHKYHLDDIDIDDGEDVITIEAPQLSSEDKRKHRAFWNQFDSKNSDNESSGEEDDEKVQKDKVRDDAVVPMDEDIPLKKVNPSSVEVLEEDEDDGKDIYSMVLNMCSDCNWITGDESKKNQEESSKQQRNVVTKKRSNSQNERMKSKETKEEKTKRSFSNRKNSFSSRQSDFDDDTYNNVEDDEDSISMKDTTKPKSILKNPQKLSKATSFSSVKSLDEPQNYENTKIEVEYDDDDEVADPEFLQLNPTGNIDVYARPDETRNQKSPSLQPSRNGDIDAMPSDERGGYTLARSKSWSEPQRNAYLHAMAQKAREDFEKRKGGAFGKVPQTMDGTIQNKQSSNGHKTVQDSDDLDDILGQKTQAKGNKTIDWTSHDWTPSEKRRLFHLVKADGMSPDQATDILMAERVQRTGEERMEMPPVPMRRAVTYTAGTRSNQAAMDPFHDVDTSALLDEGNSDILSNLRKKPGFNRVINAETREQSIDVDPKRSQNVQSTDHDNHQDDRSSKNSVRKTGISPTRRKKGSKSGPQWHQINDKDDEYPSDNNEAISAVDRSSPSTANKKANENIFDFNSPETEEENGPIDAVKLDPYNDSCDVSILGSVMAGDQTVATSRSLYTTATNASAWSTSTRRRHRGAAKNRLPDNNDKKPAGWLDTIKAAATSNNRVWDPEVGWVGYVSPEENDLLSLEQRDMVAKIGRLKPPTSVDSKSQVQQRNSYPTDWERCDDDVFSATASAAASAVTVQSNAETEIVSNKVEKMMELTRGSNSIIRETIGEDDSEEQEEEKYEVSSDQGPHPLKSIVKDTIDGNRITPAQARAREFLERMRMSPTVANSSKKKTSSDFKTIFENVEAEIKKGDKEIGSDTSDSTKSDADEFNPLTAFDYSDEGMLEEAEDDGFKVIQSTAPVSNFNKVIEGERPCDDDKSVKSSSSYMSERAKEWRKKVEINKRSSSSQRADKIVENGAAHRNIFVSAVDDDSTFEIMKERVPKVLNVDEDDTLFDFTTNNNQDKNRQPNKLSETSNIQDKKGVSRAKRIREKSDNADDLSEITTPTVDINKPNGTFLDRLQSCGADMVPTCEPERKGSGLPRAHLQFLRNAAVNRDTSKTKDNRASGGIIDMLTNPGLCGRPENIDDSREEIPQKETSKKNVASRYLDAIGAGKKVSDPKNMHRTPSTISSGSAHSETWQRFLDKRAAALSSSPKRSSTSAVSRAAQEYASKKVDEIVRKSDDNDRTRTSPTYPLTRPPSSGRPSSVRRNRSPGRPNEVMSRSDAVKAAEDLAAARVEAMMAMTPRSISQDEDEI